MQDPLRELLDLAAVHTFYMRLLERNMGHSVPVPREASQPDNAADKVGQSILTMHRWLKLLDMANRATVNRLLRAGIRVYLFPGQTHVKAMSVDGVWAYLGTGNFDPLSLRHNRVKRSGLPVRSASASRRSKVRYARAN